jgi:dihydrofolate reductase
MRSVVLLMHTSLDGFVADVNGDLSWVQHDDDIFAYVTEHMSRVDTALYGRTTYQMMEGYWPTVPKNPESTQRERNHANWVEKIEKVVVSRSLEKVTWNNSHVIKNNLAEEILALKKKPGKNIMIFGSPRLTHSLLGLGLIDELLINVNPILLGAGLPLFQGIKDKTKLALVSSKIFQVGVVGLHYKKL